MTMGKRQLVLAALIVALGAAVYLNWQFQGNNQLLATNALTSASSRTYGEAQLVEGSAVSGAPKTSSSASSSVKTSAATDSYFSQAQLARRQARDTAVELVEKIVTDTKSGDAAKKEAVDKAAVIANNTIKETNIETLIKAKGFSDCLVFLQNNECSVVVKTKDTSQNNAIVIKDIVSGQSGVPYDKIKIVEVK
ncbi:MAG TPA: SpoIIIAH-like family protein [Caproiciproducens sp.]|nr:SpoIIIAH-like family protein [Caproiciproducens sp.]